MSDCFCDYDPPEFYTRALRVARKKHVCEECNGPIIPGEKYENTAGSWDGYFSVFKTCERCVDLRTWVKNNVPCFCWAHGNLREDMELAVLDARARAPAETVGLRFGFVRRLHAINRINRERRVAA